MSADGGSHFVLIRSDRLSWRRGGNLKMELVAQVALKVTQWMSPIIRGSADVGGEIRNASRTSADGFEHLRAVFDVGELGKNVRQPRFRSEEHTSELQSPFL